VACGAGAVLFAALFAGVAVRAQEPRSLPPARVIVTGEGSVTAAPDYAEITAGVTTRARTAKEATEANSKQMTAVDTALRNAGVEQKDIQTARFSVQPLYATPQQNGAPRLTGFAVSNQVIVTIRQIATVSDVLDRMIAAGATDLGGVQFLHSDLSKALDQARAAAVTDARRKAELYAQASGLTLANVAWITEQPAYAPASPAFRSLAAAAPSVRRARIR
jgi:uncharacterized protein